MRFPWVYVVRADEIRSPRHGLFLVRDWKGERFEELSLVLAFTGWRRHLHLSDYNHALGRARTSYFIVASLRLHRRYPGTPRFQFFRGMQPDPETYEHICRLPTPFY